jgi:hypothetical protein
MSETTRGAPRISRSLFLKWTPCRQIRWQDVDAHRSRPRALGPRGPLRSTVLTGIGTAPSSGKHSCCAREECWIPCRGVRTCPAVPSGGGPLPHGPSDPGDDLSAPAMLGFHRYNATGHFGYVRCRARDRIVAITGAPEGSLSVCAALISRCCSKSGIPFHARSRPHSIGARRPLSRTSALPASPQSATG